MDIYLNNAVNPTHKTLKEMGLSSADPGYGARSQHSSLIIPDKRLPQNIPETKGGTTLK